MEGIQEPVDFERKSRIIHAMLDEVYPFRDDMPRDVADGIDVDRQMLVIRAGWNAMDAQELEALWLQGHEALPLTEK